MQNTGGMIGRFVLKICENDSKKGGDMRGGDGPKINSRQNALERKEDGRRWPARFGCRWEREDL